MFSQFSQGAILLALTSNAALVIQSLTNSPDLPGSAGLRITALPEDQQSLSLAVAPEPAAGDTVVEEQGARVFLEPSASSMLDQMVLDAEVDAQGSVQFFLGTQSGGPSPSDDGAPA
ncbi:Fe-S cluster assembly iron-binding protein IscA [Thermasporomyces composti]|jgi:Fe-S cluster assembly iron-binding protein IscA|uniref:Fe-S cluster assembly iron-binding protein IscA n=1 Tax=Thermasporomyces composti TaxID=696763 RepID=A0A3D9V7N9_THECX|nr:Fe-S cluster assembly iron-binding protein IscA [Thermasporomyces composti]